MVTALAAGAAFAQDASIRVGGSTTSLPIISACAAHFMEKFPTWDRVDASLAKEATIIYVTGGGSGFGVRGVAAGTLDVGMVSRELKESEVKALGNPLQRMFARDAVAIATNTKNPLAAARPGFTSAELASIFSGDKAQFVQVDAKLPARPIVLITRDASGGVTEIFTERVMRDAKLAPGRLQLPSTAALIKRLETNDSAIAFVSAGAVGQEAGLRTYAVDGVAPTLENIASGKYALNRPLLLVAKANPPRKIGAFFDYVTRECQAVVAEQGFVPVAGFAQEGAKADGAKAAAQ